MLEQPIEETTKDHCIRYIDDLEFIETEKVRLIPQLCGSLRDGILVVVLAVHGLHRSMNLLHERVKVQATLQRLGYAVIE